VEPALRLANGVAKRRREASHEAEQELQQAKEQQWDRKRSKQERVREALLKLPAKARLEREKRLRDEAPPAPSENAKATPHFRSSSSIDTEPSELEPEPEPTPEPEAVPVVKKARVPRETPVLLPVRDPQAREEWVRSLRSAPPGANSHLGVEGAYPPQAWLLFSL
jgi:fused signal recognition particle receptor